ncbi:hypothetical protein EYC80_003090 [Monilinia laxa]|uniref:Uncharacterized protein n=1 Tax=Monilinia laxa TaxID=61186 RepID=A0A5N6KCN1_MONLA|nr:hypothetical protein EYC80_003090 [Monilinia laxa]
MNDALDNSQGLGNIEVIVKLEKQDSVRRGSVATPGRSGAVDKSKATPAADNRPLDSIEKDCNYEPVTPTKSSAIVVQGRRRKMARFRSPEKASGIKLKADKVAKTRQSPKKDTNDCAKSLDDESSGEDLAEDDDNGDDWEDDHAGVRSDDNTWNQVDKVIGSTGKPTHPNGRAEGRKLVSWHRTRMMEKLILHIVFECRRANINLPWDKIAHRLCPASSGAAAQQFINKMRDVLITEGHLVPPPIGKKVVFDPNIRGYIRDMDAKDPKTSRSVGWDEEIVDLKESLVIPGVSRGSGSYRRNKDLWSCRKSSIAEETPTKTVRARPRPNKHLSKSKPVPKDKASKNKRERSESLDPAEMPSDDDYNPGNRLKIKGSRKRKVKVKSERDYEADEDMEKTTDSDDESFGYSDDDAYLQDTPSKKKRSGNQAMTPVAALSVKLKLPPDMLSQFPEGITSNFAQDRFADDRIEDDEDVCFDNDEALEEAYHSKNTGINNSALNDDDDIFGPEGLSLDNNHGVELRPEALFNSIHIGDMDTACNFYGSRGPINAAGYVPGYNTAIGSHHFPAIGDPTFENTRSSNSYSDDHFLGMQSFNAVSALHTNMNLGNPNGIIQGFNRGRNSIDSSSQVTGFNPGNDGFDNRSANTSYGGREFDYGTEFNPGNDTFDHNSTKTDYGGGEFDYAMASIAPDQHFEPVMNWNEQHIADNSFKPGEGL